MRNPLALAAAVAGVFWSEPVLPADSYMPVSEDNTYIVEGSVSMTTDPPDTTSFTLKKAEVIDGMQYWVDDFGGLGRIADGLPFRVDGEDSSIWIRARGARANEVRRTFLRILDRHPILMEHLQGHALGNLPGAEGELLIYDFNSPLRDWVEDDPWSHDPPTCTELRWLVSTFGGVLDYESWPEELWDRILYWAYLALLNEYLGFTVWPVALEDHVDNPLEARGFHFYGGCNSEPGFSERWFLPGVGLTHTHYYGRSKWALVWALVDGKAWGEHPGPGYPGYATAVTAITGASWGLVKEAETK